MVTPVELCRSLLCAADCLQELGKSATFNAEMGLQFGRLGDQLAPALAAWIRFVVDNHECTLSGACVRCREPDPLFDNRWFPALWPCGDLLAAKCVADVILGEWS